ncbi:MAG: hypothetical protein IJ746_02605 [Ruminococcus sp.]|nr:hypothetical protein [Ruminococcus sp.]
MRYIKAFVLAAALALTACSESSSEGYVDVGELEESLEAANTREIADTVETFDRGLVFLNWGYSFSDKEFILSEGQGIRKRIDLSNGMISSLCDIPACAHDEEISKDCFEYRPVNSFTPTRDGMYFTDFEKNGRLILRRDGREETVYTNTYYDELDEKLEPEGKSAFRFFYRDGLFYLFGQDWFYTVDAATMQQQCDPVKLSSSPIWNADVWGELLYITNEDMELICYNMKTGELTKLGDRVSRIQACEEGLYYLSPYQNEAGDWRFALSLCDHGSARGNELLDDILISFFVTDENVYYMKPDGVYIYSKESGESERLPLAYTYENGYKYKFSDYSHMVSCPSSEYVYVLSYNIDTGSEWTNTLFRIKKDTAEFEVISLGIYYQAWDAEPEILSY